MIATFPPGTVFPPKITELPKLVANSGSPSYTYRYSASGFCHEIAVQTHAELVAFINWVHSDQKAPLAAIEPERPQVL